jgi:hypothetical protein
LNFEAISKKYREQLDPFLRYALRGDEGQACNTSKRGRNVYSQGIVGDDLRSDSCDAVGGACGKLSFWGVAAIRITMRLRRIG